MLSGRRCGWSRARRSKRRWSSAAPRGTTGARCISTLYGTSLEPEAGRTFQGTCFEAAVTVVKARSKDMTPVLMGLDAEGTTTRSDVVNTLRAAFIEAATPEFCENFGVSSPEELTLHVQVERHAVWNTAYRGVIAQLIALAAELALAEDAVFMVEFDLAGKVIRREVNGGRR